MATSHSIARKYIRHMPPMAVLALFLLSLFVGVGGVSAAPSPSVPALGNQDIFLGDPATYSFNFSNSGTNTGYGPFIELAVDTSGPDGAGGLPLDGYGTPTVIVAGLQLNPVTMIPVVGGTFINPLTGDVRAVPAGFGANDTIYIYELPFGSFTPGQTTLTTITVPTSNRADLATPLPIAVTPGFRDDTAALNGPAIYGPTSTGSVIPQLYGLKKIYLGPEDETATGPNFPRRYRLEVDVATGQSVTNLVVTDDLAASMQITGRTTTRMFAATAAGGLTTNIFVAGNSAGTAVTTAPDGTLTYNFGGLTGVAGVDAVFEFEFYIPRDDSTAAQVVPQTPLASPTTGTDSTFATNTADSRLDWVPIDSPRDPSQTNVPPATPFSTLTHILEQHSLAIQKTAETIDPTTGAVVPAGQIVPGSTLIRYTLNFQVSDYYAVQNVLINDVLGDGLRLFTGTRGAVNAGVPTLSVANAFLTGSPGSRTNLAVGTFGGGTINYERRYSLEAALPPGTASDPTSFPGAGPIDAAFSTTVGGTINGSTLLNFDISAELVRRLGSNAGRLVGGEINNDGTGPDNDPFAGPNLGGTTGRIVFYAEVSQDFSDDFPSSDRSVDQGDILKNTINDPLTAGRDGIIAEQIRPSEINDPAPTVIGSATDDSGASTQIGYGTQSKTIDFINGQSVPTQAFFNPPYSVQPGDRITYRLTYTLPINSYEQLRITDFPPLPVMPVGAASLYSFEGTAAPSYGSYTVAIAPDDTFFTTVGFIGAAAPPVQAATTAALGGGTSFNAGGGTAGNGAFTGAPTVVDGVTLVAGNLVLVKDQVDQRQNGVYTVVSAGNWERDTSMNSESEIESSHMVRVLGGTVNAAIDFVHTNREFSTFNAVGTRGDIVFGPFISTDQPNNGILLNFGNFDDPLRRSGKIALYLTLPIGNDPFGKALFLTNQMRVNEASTNNGTTTVEEVRRFELVRPDLIIQKGVVGANTTGFTLGGIAFSNPSLTATFSGGPIDTATEANAIGASNIGITNPVDAGDTIRYAIVAQNAGKGDAYDVVITDTIPIAYNRATFNPATDLVLRHGDTTLVTTSAAVTGFVRFATNADLGSTYNSVPSNGQFTDVPHQINGILVDLNNRVLVKDQAIASENGIYAVTAIDLDAATVTLTRAADADTAAELNNYRVAVAGDSSPNIHYQASAVTTINTDAVNWGASLGVRDYYTSYIPATGELQILLSDTYSAGNINSPTEDNRTGAISRGMRTDQTLGDVAITNGSNTLVVLYDVTLQSTVTPNQTLPNTATITTYSNNDGGQDLTDPAIIDNATDPTDSASVVSRLPLTGKTLVSTEITAPGNNGTGGAGAQATIGELITYQVTLTVPEGSTPGAQIVDTLEQGLAFVDITDVQLSSNSLSTSTGLTFANNGATNVATQALPANSVVSAINAQNGRRVTFSLGTITNSNTDNTVAETVAITYRAVVLNVNNLPAGGGDPLDADGNQAGDLRRNTADFNWTGNTTIVQTIGAGQTTSISGTRSGTLQEVAVVEPTLTNLKDVRNVTQGETFPVAPGTPQTTRGDAGDTMQYRITIQNPAIGSTTANDVTLSDQLPVTFFTGGAAAFSVASVTTTGAGQIRRDGVARTLDATDFTISGAGLLELNTAFNYDIDPAVTITLLITGTNFSGATGQLVNNIADLRWTSLDGTPGTRSTNNTSSTERTGADGEINSGVLNDYRDTDNAIIESPPIVRKTIVATSEASTSDPNAAVGEIMRFRLVASVAEGTAGNFQIQDFLPTGFSFLNDGTVRWALVSTNGNALASTTTISGIPSLGAAIAPGTGGIDGNQATVGAIASSSIIGTFADENISTDANGVGTGDPIVYADGADVFFRFGTLANSDNDTDVEYAIVEFNALVRNQVSNQAGTALNNRLTILVDTDGNGTAGYIDVVTDANGDGVGTGEATIVASDPLNNATGTAAQSAPTTVTVVEPSITVNKQVIATTGAVVTYQVTLTAGSAANTTTAFNTRALDILNGTDLTLIGGSVTAPTFTGSASGVTDASAGNTVDVTITTMAPGSTATFTYQANVLTTPVNLATLDNTVNVTYTSLPGTSGTGGNWAGSGVSSTVPGASSSPTGERTGADGVGGALNDYAVADTERLGSVGDRVYFDADGDGVQDAGEAGIVGVTVTVTWAGPDGSLATAGDNSVITVITGANGIWTVTGLPIGGLYQVGVPATLSGMSVTDAVDNGILTASNTSNVTLTVGTPNPRDQDFGYRGTASLGNRIYIDADGDGVQDVNGLEPSLPGVATTLTWAGPDAIFGNADDLTFTQNATNAATNYLYSNLPSGDFRVAVSPTGGIGGVPDNTTLTDALDNGGPANTNPNALGAGIVQTNLTTGENELTIDFGYQGTASIGNYVWYDADGDGVQDVNESGIAGATVTLLWGGPDGTIGAGGDDVTFTTTTDASGLYLFPSLPVNGASDPYRVTVTPVAAYPTQTFDADGIGTANTSSLNLAQTENNTAQDFGYRGTAQLGNLVWQDQNGNGRQDVGDLGIDGVSVSLFFDINNDGDFADTGEGTAIANTTTAGGGLYSFTNLAAGNYQVVFGNSDGVTTYTRTIIDSAVATDATDSDAAIATGRTGTYTLALGDNNQTVDAGLFIPISLGDRVFYDVDGDGVQDVAEVGISSVTITVVWLGPDGVLGGGDDQTFTTTTGANGIWSVTNLPPGNFQITSATPPNGLTTLTDSLDNGLLSATNPVTISTTSGINRTDIDFGFRGTATLGDRVWVDQDSDGVQDVGEPGLPTLPVTLTWFGQDGILGGGDDVTYTTTTGADGAYSFIDLPAGNYSVTVDTTGTNLAPTYDLDSGTTSPNGITATTLTIGQNRTDVDFGYVGNASVGDRVWLDQNSDGIQDPTEVGLAGTTILVTWSGTDGTFGTADDVIFTTTTGANGAYLVNGLPANPLVGATPNYRVAVTGLPITGLTLTDSLDNGTLNPVNPIDIQVSPINGDPLNDRRDVDFGYDGASSLAGTVYRDDNNNGVQDAGEPGIAGVTLTLTGVDVFGNPYLNPITNAPYQVTTDINGDYVFATVVPGTATITESQPANYNDGIDTAGSLGGNAGNDVISGILVGPNQTGVEYNFGEIGTFVSGVVFRDDNRDGVLDPTETTRLPGVTVELFDSTGLTLLKTAITGPDGSYRFDHIAIGTYQIRETQPTNYASSPVGPFAPNTRNVNVPAPGLPDQNFAEILASIGGVVYVDADNNGTRDGSDTARIGNVPVTLTGTDSTGNPVNITVFTDPTGAYRFDNLFASNPAGYTINEGSAAPYTDRAANPGTGVGGALGTAAGVNSITGIGLTVGNQGINYDFGEVLTAQPFIAGSVYRDDNRDGVRDSAELPIPGVTITLYDAGQDGIFGNADDGTTLTATTDSAGNYLFPNLSTGRSYRVIETQPSAYGNSPLGPTVFIAVSNLPVTGSTNNNFGEVLGSLAGSVYFDANNNGTRDAGEPGIAGTTITLSGTDVDGNPVNRTITTATDGSYSFINLATGSYVVTETQPAIYADGGETIGSAGGINSANDLISAIPLGAGVDAVSYNYGEIGVPVSGIVFHDANRDGNLNVGENPIPAVTIRLVDSTGTMVATTTTLPDGSYLFPNVAPGTYTIIEVQPTGYGDPLVGPFAPNNRPITVTNIAITNQNYGDTLSTLAGSVYVDLNNNGIREGAEVGISGVSVRLDWAGPDGIFGNGDDLAGFATTTTGVNGDYLFTDLPTGTYRVVEPTQPAPYNDGLETPGAQGGNTGTNEQISAIPVAAGADLTSYNFGELPPANSFISGSVYIDTNNNGIRDIGEPGIPGVTITLTGPGGPFTTTTDTNGNYIFPNLTSGAAYTITESQPASYGNGLENPGNIITIAALPAAGSINNNFGELPGTISGIIYFDRDNSATLSAGDVRLPGVTLTLQDGTGAAVNDPRTGQPYVAVTGADGSYLFENLPAGNYRVIETQPAGYNDGSENPGVGNSSTINDRIEVVLPAGGNSPDNNYGELGTSLSGTVWIDSNRDGVLTGEAGRISGVTIRLLDSNGNQVASTTTDPSGNYSFGNLPLGNYTIIEDQPNIYGSTTPNTISVTLTVAGSTGNNFGEVLSSLAGSVYADLNNNGLREAGEPGIPGTTVTLAGTDVNGNPISQTTTTDSNGNYSFTDLPTGTYQVLETQPTGFSDGLDQAGTAGGSTATNDQINTIPLGAGVDTTSYNFGEIGVTISGTVWLDRDRDGTLDTGEPGIGGVTIELRDSKGTLIRTITTNPDGTYLFVGLEAGVVYTITEIQPTGYGSSTPNVITTPIVPNTGLTDQNFGETLGRISGSVYIDADDDGIRDPNESGISGTTITLIGTDANGNPIRRTTITDSNGNYAFTDLPIGTYTVVETQPLNHGDGRDTIGSAGGTLINDQASGIILTAGGDATAYDFGENPLSPTAVVLASFSATREADGVAVRWETVAELDSWGFQLYRSSTDNREDAVLITPELIAATGRGQGARYEWRDTSAQPGVTYSYWLVETEIGGQTVTYGPIRSQEAAPTEGGYRVFLPDVSR